jgi:outer membrane receptor for ferrienterochelin and colicin
MNRLFSLILCLLQTATCWAQEGDLFEFFREEARVTSASRRPQPLYRAPATVYVVSGEELMASGAQTLWDGLRRVPGVDVIDIRSLYGGVSIRGLAKPLNNRTLVLLDGRTILDGYVDTANWEMLPVLMEEVERIEVVEGPISALYGANAINGVINIITRKPEQLQGGLISIGGGEPGERKGSFLYGRRGGKVEYKMGAGWRTADPFEGEGIGGEIAKLHGLIALPLGAEGQLQLSGGAVQSDMYVGLGGLGEAREEGRRLFVRADYTRGNTRVRWFWNEVDVELKELLQSKNPEIHQDTYDASLEQTLTLGRDHDLVVGLSVRRNQINSTIVSATHDLWSVYGEDEWRFARRWTLWSSGRLDRHPFSGMVLSPRFSLVFTPSDRHTVRFSTGSSFRNPTQIENHVDVLELFRTTGGLPDLEAQVEGNEELDPELIFFSEAAHNAQLGRLQTTLAIFHYRLRNVVSLSPPIIDLSDPEVLQAQVTFINTGRTRAWGGEAAIEWVWDSGLAGFANYAYQRLSGELDRQISLGGRPHHKFNGGVRVERGDLVGSLSLHRVGETFWNENRLPRQDSWGKVDGYTLINAHLNYRFPGRWNGLNLGLDAFNLLDDNHYQILPRENDLMRGQGGERIGARRTARLTYRF